MLVFIRSTLFNGLFYPITAIYCVLFLPCLLGTRALLMRVIHFYLSTVLFLEKYVLGLTYEVRGIENIGHDGTFIVAAKHQSAYETLKLHFLLGDPTIVLKKELLSIPLFGEFLKKIDVIAIDRRNKEESINAIVEGANKMKESNRPILIFPQGTRVHPSMTSKDKSYKGGIAKMYSYTKLPIVPMALNSGLFWGRNSYIKRPGKVVFEFLPMIEAGLPEKQVMKTLEYRLEEKSIALMNEAKQGNMLLSNIEVAQLQEAT